MRHVIFLTLVIACQSVFSAGEKTPPIPDKTTVTPTLDAPHQNGQNLIWCSTFQLAWNALGKEFCGEPLRLAGTPAFEKSMNAAKANVTDIDAESVLTRVGKVTPAFVDGLNADLKKRFGETAPVVNVETGGTPKVLAYAYLEKNLSFKTPLDKRREPIAWAGTEGAGAVLQAFGLSVGYETHPEQMREIKIVSESPDGYIIELVTTSEKDRIFLAQTKPGATLQATLDTVRKRILNPASAPFAIQVSDLCLVPCIELALERVYSEIRGKSILNAKLDGYFIYDARQNIRINLNEKGAVLKSDARLGGAKNGHQPRSIVFDEPFLLFIERDGAKSPYLAIWFENPNLFVKGDVNVKPSEKGRKPREHSTPKF